MLFFLASKYDMFDFTFFFYRVCWEVLLLESPYIFLDNGCLDRVFRPFKVFFIRDFLLCWTCGKLICCWIIFAFRSSVIGLISGVFLGLQTLKYGFSCTSSAGSSSSFFDDEGEGLPKVTDSTYKSICLYGVILLVKSILWTSYFSDLLLGVSNLMLRLLMHSWDPRRLC